MQEGNCHLKKKKKNRIRLEITCNWNYFPQEVPSPWRISYQHQGGWNQPRKKSLGYICYIQTVAIHSLSFAVTCCHSLYHLLSFVVTLYHSLSLVVTSCHSMYHSSVCLKTTEIKHGFFELVVTIVLLFKYATF